MKENLTKVNKVWQAFVKFLRSQVLTNGKCVDTQLIGLFFKDEKQILKFMPSTDYLEAGKFKFRWNEDFIDGLKDDAVEDYQQKYRNKLEVSRF